MTGIAPGDDPADVPEDSPQRPLVTRRSMVIYGVVVVFLAVLIGGTAVVLHHRHHMTPARDQTASAGVSCRKVEAAISQVSAAETSINSGATLGDDALVTSLRAVLSSAHEAAGVKRGPLSSIAASVGRATGVVLSTVEAQYAEAGSRQALNSDASNKALEGFSLADNKLTAYCAHQ